MSRSRRNTEGLLARVNFPLYSLQMLTSRHVLVAGGGGSAKTGVANGFEVFEITYDGKRYVAKEVVRHETGPKVVMNCAAYSNNKYTYLAAGQEGHCQLYKVLITVEKEGTAGSDEVNKGSNGLADSSGLRNRKPESKQSNDSKEGLAKVLKFEFVAADSILTDYGNKDGSTNETNDSEAMQRVVRISRCGKLMACGGTDGHVRLWFFPSLTPHKDIEAHSKELDDLDFSPNSKMLASVSKDGKGLVWEVVTGKQSFDLKWTPPNGTKYLFKRCRFGVVEENKRKSRIFTISNSMGTNSKQANGIVAQWDGENGNRLRHVIVEETLSALAVRDDGRFLAVGTMFSGSVRIYIGFSLQCAMVVPQAHSTFVTALELLPAEGCAISSNSEAAVISISIDNRICIHNLPYRRTLPPWLVIIVIVIVLFLTFTFCSYLGL
ncbi:prolactin regulatory [Nesidiocoris tenuis]|uniref:Prolactin regulatory n=1 Tax=Nesidiocoris tenuis TaxID=355587 RepID=A0ABN7AC53_9HEMI|nr:prolactin regulatory [Nesidiocoris tenuis]